MSKPRRHTTSFQRRYDVVRCRPTSYRHWHNVACLQGDKYILLGHTPSRHLQDVSSLPDVFNTFLRRTTKTIIYRKICLGHTSEKFMIRVKNFQEWTLWIYRNFLKTVFLKHFMKWPLLQTKTLLLKSGIKKDVAVSVNKESVNKNSSKNVFLRFYFFTLLHLLVVAYRGIFRTWSSICKLAFFCENT